MIFKAVKAEYIVFSISDAGAGLCFKASYSFFFFSAQVPVAHLTYSKATQFDAQPVPGDPFPRFNQSPLNLQ